MGHITMTILNQTSYSWEVLLFCKQIAVWENGYRWCPNIAKYNLPLSSLGSWACHTYCDLGHPFIMVISEGLWHPHMLDSLCLSSCYYLCLRLMTVVIRFELWYNAWKAYALLTDPPRRSVSFSGLVIIFLHFIRNPFKIEVICALKNYFLHGN